MVSVLSTSIMSVWPSGAALATWPAAIPPFPAGRFSMITGCRSDSDSRSASARATRSLAPPAAVVTTSCMDLDG